MKPQIPLRQIAMVKDFSEFFPPKAEEEPRPLLQLEKCAPTEQNNSSSDINAKKKHLLRPDERNVIMTLSTTQRQVE